MAILVKEPSELSPDHQLDALCGSCLGCRLLVPSRASGADGEPPADEADAIRRLEYDGDAGSLRVAVGRVAEKHLGVPLVVVAPYFALKEAALESLDPPEGLTLFANNYLAQGHKLKGCKPLVNRAVCRLLHLEPRSLESFPLMSRLDGIWVADLGLLPEKYRLDPGRCEEVLIRALDAWLAAVEARLRVA
jgi:hypothetical protein